MSRERKPVRKPASSSGGVLIGIFIGLVMGALLAAGTAWYLTQSSPFQAPQSGPVQPIGPQAPVALPGKPGDRPVERQNFDFYRILPEAGSGGAAVVTPVAPASEPVRRETLYLQVGAFENPAEADNLKAMLALNGIQSNAQRAQLADGRTVHRVRIGPYSSPEDMSDMRARVANIGLSASLVRVSP